MTLNFLSKNKIKPLAFWFLIFIVFMIFFSSGLNNFFAGDDWYHLQITQIKTPQEFINFFSPFPNPQNTSFYRPISTQLFFFIGQNLFQWQAFYYHLIIYLFFAVSVYLFWKLLDIFSFSKKSQYLAMIFYILSATHFTRLYFISANQEIMMVTFVLAYWLLSLQSKNPFRNMMAQFFLILALLSKETAVVAPIMLTVIKIWQLQSISLVKIKKLFGQNYELFGHYCLLLIYFFIRFFVFDSSMTFNDPTYQFVFSPKVTLNSLYFYFWWLLGAPELIQDYLAKPYLFISRFFTDFPTYSTFIIVSGISWLTYIFTTFINYFNKNRHIIAYKNIILGFTVIFIGLLPVIFLPYHKFTIQLGLPMMGMAIILAELVASWQKKSFLCLGIGLFLIFNLITLNLTKGNHYAVQRAKISHQAYHYFQDHYPTLESNTIIYIINSDTPGHEISTWGSSKQIALALWHSNFIQALYQDKSLQMKFEDLDNFTYQSNDIVISAAELFP